jgi:broad specificity phosphatase PhoE
MGLVLLVRHGQASFGADDYDVLSETGVEQGRILGRALAEQGISPSRVVHGAMKRQADSATAMVEAGGWEVRPELDVGWNEFDHLAVVARRIDELEQHGELIEERLRDRRGFQRVFEEATVRWSGGAHDDEYAEPWPAFLTRTRDALDRACAHDGTTVVVSSGGPIASACAALVDPLAPPEEVSRLWHAFNTVTANASVTRVIEGSTGRRLLTLNEHAHLPRELVTYR